MFCFNPSQINPFSFGLVFILEYLMPFVTSSNNKPGLICFSLNTKLLNLVWFCLLLNQIRFVFSWFGLVSNKHYLRVGGRYIYKSKVILQCINTIHMTHRDGKCFSCLFFFFLHIFLFLCILVFINLH